MRFVWFQVKIVTNGNLMKIRHWVKNRSGSTNKIHGIAAPSVSRYFKKSETSFFWKQKKQEKQRALQNKLKSQSI